MSKFASPPQGPETQDVPETRLAQRIAHDILLPLAAMIRENPILFAAFQDQTSNFSLAIARLEQESYDSNATLEAVGELYTVLQRLLETYEESSNPTFIIPPVLKDDFATRSEFAKDQVRAEILEEEIHETAKKIILRKKDWALTNVRLHIRARVAQEIRAIIDFAMQDCVLETAEAKEKVTEILEGTKNAAILALLHFDDGLLRIMKQGYPETGRNGQLATIILAVRRQISNGEIPTPKKRRGLKISYHPSDARLEGCDIGTVRAVAMRAIQGLHAGLGKWGRPATPDTSAESTDVPANPQSSPDET